MIKELTKLANHLDKRGFKKEADYLDDAIRSYADRLDRAERRRDIGVNNALCEKYEATMKFFEEQIIPRVESNQLQYGFIVEQANLYYSQNEAIKQASYSGLDVSPVTLDGQELTAYPTLREIFRTLESSIRDAGCNSLSTKLRHMWSRMVSSFNRLTQPRRPEEPSDSSEPNSSELNHIEWCPEGQTRNPDTGECEEVPAPPPLPCPEGYVRNPDTGECEQIQNPADDLWTGASIHEPKNVRRGGW